MKYSCRVICNITKEKTCCHFCPKHNECLIKCNACQNNPNTCSHIIKEDD